MNEAVIPPRSASRYGGHYSSAGDLSNLTRILDDSIRLALTSKNAETAVTRFELAIEIYYAIQGARPSGSVMQAVTSAVTALVGAFPETVVINEAQGFIDKAAKLKSPKKKLENLTLARTCLERFANGSPSTSGDAMLLLAQVQGAIASLPSVP